MDDTTTTAARSAAAWTDTLALSQAAAEYWHDAWQRSILYTDIRRQRGDQYRAHMREAVPNVLNFPSKLVMSGRDLPRPVNYGMVRIQPPQDMPADETKRPFVVIDPRAGHGPGIGGFKPDSEIGAAMRAGHPCYFVGFLPNPEPGQTVEDVMRADAAFVRKAAELHPDSRGKPAVIGNCQAGWQVLMAASLWPELFGPIIVAGSPLSYWAGDNPMRYVGGLTGGSWLTAFTSDLGHGRFDGAWLVRNFENLDPANTLWAKQYRVYANVDTEGPRYLSFEKYWGGYVYLNDVEMQYIVDELFIGNKLATAELLTSDGLRIDLRNIRSPIVVFCSYGDNITPPAQALGWITDLYRDDADVVSNDQTIIYATHDSIGHLGIFVSSSVGRKEHQEFAAHIDLIDLIPPGLYRATVQDNPDAGAGDVPYHTTIRPSNLEEVRGIVQPDPQAERRFQAAARVSEINLALYRSFVQPWVRACTTPQSAEMLQNLHPLRIGYERWSSQHPWAGFVESAAQYVREHRQAASPDNPFLVWQDACSDMLVRNLDAYRDLRDQGYAQLFETIYGSPWVQALTGHALNDDGPARPHPGQTPEQKAFVQRRIAQLGEEIGQGGLLEGGIRALLYTLRRRGHTDAHCFRQAMQMRPPVFAKELDFARFKAIIRRQALLLEHDEAAAVAAIPALLKDANQAQIQALSQILRALVCDVCEPTPEERQALEDMQAMLKQAAADIAADAVADMPVPAAIDGTTDVTADVSTASTTDAITAIATDVIANESTGAAAEAPAASAAASQPSTSTNRRTATAKPKAATARGTAASADKAAAAAKPKAAAARKRSSRAAGKPAPKKTGPR